MQDIVDGIADVFIDAVAFYRDTDRKTVLHNYGKGSIVVARSALEKGMIDKIESFDSMTARLENGSNVFVFDTNDPEIFAGATPFRDLQIIDKEWDSTAAIQRVRRQTGSTEKPSASYKNAFFWYDSENAENFGSYKLPFADVDAGQLKAVRRGVFAANGAMKGARGGVDIPAQDRPAVQKHIDRYIEKIAKEDEKENASNIPARIAGSTKMEDQKMKLKELIASDPDLAREVEEIKTEAFASGVSSVKTTIEKVTPFLSKADTYGKEIVSLAVKVLKGETDVAALDAGVSVYDALKAKSINDKAIDETNAQEATPPSDGPNYSTDGLLRTTDDFMAEIARLKATA